MSVPASLRLGSWIEVNVDRHGSALRVSVVDQGPGIPKDFQKHVFEVFAQADSSSPRGMGGVGLGLSICKSIVEAHGGRIGFTSKEGQGTTFYFDLPLAKSTIGRPPPRSHRAKHRASVGMRPRNPASESSREAPRPGGVLDQG
jgi:nitrogen-specific signal transduction histidine kinase